MSVTQYWDIYFVMLGYGKNEEKVRGNGFQEKREGNWRLYPQTA